jgi:hypothetical protein
MGLYQAKRSVDRQENNKHSEMAMYEMLKKYVQTIPLIEG